MTTDVRRRPAAPAAFRPIPVRRRIYGFGSVFGKAVRDSRRATLLVTGWIVMLWLVIGSSTAATFGTVQARQEAVALTKTLPAIFQGLYGGDAPNVQTLGGLASWRYGLMFLIVPGVWSLLALSSTLITETRRGSMEFVAATPLSRRRIAIEKLAGHVVSMTLAMAVVAVLSWFVGTAFATLPGDEIPLEAAAGYATYMGLIALATGAVAFGLSPLAGRGAGAGIAIAILIGGWLINGFRDAVPVFGSLAPLSWFNWTLNHKPIAGVYDWPSLLTLVPVIVVGFVVGSIAFERRDLGAIGSLPTPSMPRWLLGVSGPLARSFGERVTIATAWGIAIGLYGLMIASSADALRDMITGNQTISQLLRAAFPNLDPEAPGFGLQLAFLAFGYLAVGLSAITLLFGWSSDENEGRLDLLLAAPLARARWLIESGLGVYFAIVVTAVLIGVGLAAGTAAAGDDPTRPAVGAAVLALYGMAVAGIGLGAGGLLRSSAAGVVTALLVVGTFLLDIIVPALQLPDEVHELALTAHYGEPMLGNWDPVGIVGSLGLALGGLAVGAWGFSRRDLKG